MREQNHVDNLRRTVMRLVAEIFLDGGNINEKIDKIPFVIRENKIAHDRCCVYKDRAILRYRCMAAMGFLPEDENGDESLPLNHFARLAQERDSVEAPFIISALDIACHGCSQAQYFVTNICQGCVAHPCVGACKFQAIKIINGQSQIEATQCRNCGKCMEACPYCAIVKLTVPCERACPVDAIKKNGGGRAEIDFESCTSCGHCLRACPFGAILERSQIVDVLKLFAAKKHVTALVAPAIAGQFSVSMRKLFSGLQALGFSSVIEVAAGADITSQREAQEFIERKANKQRFMTTSCCPSYVHAVRKHIPELLPFVSDTKTPMHYAAELAKERLPDTKTVFIGPCVAKRVECMEDKDVDMVLTFEELNELFSAKKIVLEDCPDASLGQGASREGRGYAISGGVAAAVQKAVGESVEVLPVMVDGLSIQKMRLLKRFALKECPGNLVEVMACEGGCSCGSGVFGNYDKVTKGVAKFAADGDSSGNNSQI